MNPRLLSILLTVLLGTLLAAPLSAAAHATQDTTPDFAAIDRYVQDQMADSRIPGVALAVVAGDQIIHAAGFGSAGGDREVTPQTPFPVGSLIKSFTAVAIMQLVERGAVDLDAPVQRYLPWFQVADEVAATRITVRHLLNQTSGLSRQTGIALLSEQQDTTFEAVVRDLGTAHLNRPVGESYEYSNANFATLALIVETVAGDEFGDYLDGQILAPLGMRHSAATNAATPVKRTDVHQYWFGMSRAVSDAYQPSEFPGEYLIASAEDIARYLAMYLGGGSLAGATVLTPASVGQLLQPATNEATRQLLSTEFTFRYGMGWFAGSFGAAPDTRWHLGELPYFNAWMILLPDTNQGVVVLINAGSQLEFFGANEVMSRIPLGVVNLLRGGTAPTGLGLIQFYVGFDLAVGAILVVQLWALVRLVRGPLALAQRRQGSRRFLGLTRGIGPLAWELGLGLALLIGWPVIAGMGWSGSWMAFPDLTLVLLAVAGLWLATGMLRTARLAQAWLDHRQMLPVRREITGGFGSRASAGPRPRQ